MQDSSTALRRVLGGNTADGDPESESGLPSLADGQYQPYARPASKPVFSIHFINNKGEVRSFQNVHLDSDSRFSAGSIELRFMGMEPVKVTIHGRNLWRLYDYLHQHRTAWVAESPRDFAADGQPAVLKVNFEKIA